MFQASNYLDRAPVPHGQTIHVWTPATHGFSGCTNWIVLDSDRAWSPRFTKVILNWSNDLFERDWHWEWECGKSP